MIGAAWWSQGWHLPQLERNPDAEIAAIMQRSEQPTAAKFLDLTLETKTQLAERYKGVPIFSSCEELLADEEALAKVDGVIICTAHSCHADMGMKFLKAGKHVLMEKPMTVDVAEARTLAAAAAEAAPQLKFMVNNTANFRDHCFDARKLVEEGALGEIHHVLCVMYSPLMFLFDDPANTGWVKPSGSMTQPGVFYRCCVLASVMLTPPTHPPIPLTLPTCTYAAYNLLVVLLQMVQAMGLAGDSSVICLLGCSTWVHLMWNRSPP